MQVCLLNVLEKTFQKNVCHIFCIFSWNKIAKSTKTCFCLPWGENRLWNYWFSHYSQKSVPFLIKKLFLGRSVQLSKHVTPWKLYNAFYCSTVSFFSIWKSLWVFQKARIKIVACAIYTFQFFSFTYTLLLCSKISCCNCFCP